MTVLQTFVVSASMDRLNVMPKMGRISSDLARCHRNSESLISFY